MAWRGLPCSVDSAHGDTVAPIYPGGIPSVTNQDTRIDRALPLVRLLLLSAALQGCGGGVTQRQGRPLLHPALT